MASVRQGTDAAAISWYSGGTAAKNGDRLHDCTCLTNIRYGAVPAGVRAVPETQ